MYKTLVKTSLFICLTLFIGSAFADKKAASYQKTIEAFQSADATKPFFDNAYGYAVFPNIGKGGIGIGGAHGKGRVYEAGKHVGNTSMSQVTVGFQLGGQAYSQIIFFQDKRSFDEFTSGNFEFGAQATAVAITAGASAEASTKGNTAGASAGSNNATAVAKYNKGMAVFTVAKGGLMYEASLGGQKFNYKPL